MYYYAIKVIRANRYRAKINNILYFTQETSVKHKAQVKIESKVEVSVKKSRKKRTKILNEKENLGEAKCKICDKVFKSEKHLGWHLRYHKEDSKTYTCAVCNKEFKTKMRLYAHNQTHKIERCNCDICGKSFDTRKNYTDHIYKHHRTDIQCKKKQVILWNLA